MSWARGVVIVAAVTALIAGCAELTGQASPTIGESMPGPAEVWLTSEPVMPSTNVSVVMTAVADPEIRFAHTFPAGSKVQGLFATSEGRYVLAALGGACSLPLTLGPDDAADVLLTLGTGQGCTLAVVRRGRMGDPAMQKPDDGVLITNHDAGGTTGPS